MNRKTEAPVTEVRERHGLKETVTKHPAFGQIVAHRVTGHAVLYGTDVIGPGYVIVTIRRSEEHRTLSRDWHFADNEVIQIAMSEAQWAAFVSGLNVGSGPCCTIDHIQGEHMPLIAEPERTRADAFSEEISEVIEKIQRELREAIAEIPDGPASKTRVAELKKELERLAQHIGSNTHFVAKQFSEHIDDTVMRAKLEINAHVTNVLVRAGVEALNDKQQSKLLGDTVTIDPEKK